MEEFLKSYMLDQLKKLLGITSMIGYNAPITEYLLNELNAMGYAPRALNKGGIILEAGGSGNAIVVAAHADEIGLVVRKIRDDGKLMVVSVVGMLGPYCNCTNVKIITRGEKVYTGILHRIEASLHTSDREKRLEASDIDKNMVVSIDEDVSCAADVRALGIRPGDIVAVEPDTVFTDSGYIKSRYIDDNAAVAILLTYLKYIRDEKVIPSRKVYAFFTMFEEKGFGSTTGVPEDAEEMMSIDIGCVSDTTEAGEHKVSICAWDAVIPYHRGTVTKLIETAEKNGIDYAIDVYYPGYGSDTSIALLNGSDVRGSLIGPGVLGTHAYERTHTDALVNTYRLLRDYLA